MTTDSQRQEREAAKRYGGKVNAGSGNSTGHKNDVRTPRDGTALSIEFKTTRAKSYSLKREDLLRAEREALLDGRSALFGVEFRIEAPYRRFRYVVISEDDFLDLLER